MAIFGVGSTWDGVEQKEIFFRQGKFILGWNDESAKDVYVAVASLKVGDILYLKSNQPGARIINVKGVGIVTENFMNCINCIINGDYDNNVLISNLESLFVRVAWLNKEEFEIVIPDNEGRLTCFRAATIYEEFLPLVQAAILNKIIDV